MYVAITRARQRLYLSFSQTRMLHGQLRYNVKSRWFDELPDSCLKWLSPRQGGFGQGRWNSDFEANPPMAPSASVQSSRTHASGWRSGQGVFHTKFGEGVILLIEGSGADARAKIRFARHGEKWLALAVAKLTPTDD